MFFQAVYFGHLLSVYTMQLEPLKKLEKRHKYMINETEFGFRKANLPKMETPNFSPRGSCHREHFYELPGVRSSLTPMILVEVGLS